MGEGTGGGFYSRTVDVRSWVEHVEKCTVFFPACLGSPVVIIDFNIVTLGASMHGKGLRWRLEWKLVEGTRSVLAGGGGSGNLSNERVAGAGGGRGRSLAD